MLLQSHSLCTLCVGGGGAAVNAGELPVSSCSSRASELPPSPRLLPCPQMYFSKNWGTEGTVDLFVEFSKLITLTAARTLLGAAAPYSMRSAA